MGRRISIRPALCRWRTAALWLFVASGAFISAAAAQSTAAQNISVSIRNGKADPSSIRLTQGQPVELSLTSDRSMQLHLHGYDLIADVEPGVTATLSFIARLAGRFPVELHRKEPAARGGWHGGAIFYVEVYPP
jgi:hypothetical protein